MMIEEAESYGSVRFLEGTDQTFHRTNYKIDNKTKPGTIAYVDRSEQRVLQNSVYLRRRPWFYNTSKTSEKRKQTLNLLDSRS